MNTKLHIGNVSANTTQAELRSLFARQGPVLEVKLVMDAEAGRSLGYASVTMETHEGGPVSSRCSEWRDDWRPLHHRE